MKPSVFNLLTYFFFLTKLCSRGQRSLLILYDRKIGHFWHFVVPDLYAKDRPDIEHHSLFNMSRTCAQIRNTFFSSSCKPCKKITMTLFSHYFWRIWRFSWVGIMAEEECACEKGSRDIMCSLRFLYLRRRRSNSIPWCIFAEASPNISVIADFIVK